MSSTGSGSSLLLQNGTVLIHNAQDHVITSPSTSILIENDTITGMGCNLSTPSPNTRTIDCTGKIISPGLISTHAHLWQTQLKGCHADQQLLEYMGSGMAQAFNYTPQDSYWGQLAGCLEAIDAGTTTVLDHAHGCYTKEHAEGVLKASVASGIRAVLALTPIAKLKSWDQQSCVPGGDLTLDWTLEFVEGVINRDGKEGVEGRVNMGFGFDLFFLPEEVVKGVFARVRKAGVKVITNHVVKNNVLERTSTTELMNGYGLLGKDVVFSHATALEQREKEILWKEGVYVSSTPETECQMAMGWPVAMEKNVHGSLGIDCHTNNSSSIVTQARMLLQMARQENNMMLAERGQYPKKLRGCTEQVFNLATIEGARALGMESEVGSIKVGKKADLVVWEWEGSVGMLGCRDPLVAVMRHSDLRDVDTVVVGGVVRKEGGKLCAVEVEGHGKMEWKNVAREVMKSREEVVKRGEGCSLEKIREVFVGLFGVDETKLVDAE